MTLLDDIILSSIFKPEYMKFTTCSRLKSVSSNFYTYARKYNLSLRRFDFNTLKISSNHRDKDAEVFLPKCDNLAFFRLFNTITLSCPNLTKIKHTTTKDQMFDFDHFSYWLRLPFLVQISFDSFTANATSISVLNRMSALKSLRIYFLRLDIGEYDKEERPHSNEVDHAKLSVPILKISIYALDFWSVFNLQNVQCLTIGRLSDIENFRCANEILSLCPNLESLKVYLHLITNDKKIQYLQETCRFVTNVESLPKFKEFNLKLRYSMRDIHTLIDMCPRICKYIQGILIYSVDREDFNTIFRLQQLSYISWSCKLFDHQLMFNELPRLDVIKTDLNSLNTYCAANFHIEGKISRYVSLSSLLLFSKISFRPISIN